MPDSATPPAGWLLDPDDAALLRWWDGARWSAFRRPRADLPAETPPVGTLPAPGPASTAPAAPVEVAPFWSQYDDVVLAVTAPLDDATRARRQSVAATARDRVVAGAAPGERVVALLPVDVFDLHRHGDRAGTRLFTADLVATDQRLLLWADETDADLAVIDVALADVVAVRDLLRPAVALTLAGEARPLVLAARDADRAPDLPHLLRQLLGHRPGSPPQFA